MPHHLRGRQRHPGRQPRPARQRPHQPRPQHQVQHVKRQHRRHIPAAQRDGRGANANAQIVVAVHHRVLGVVRQHPKQVGHEQGPRQRRNFAAHGGKRHRDAKAERHAQHRLRHGKKALRVGVEHRHGQRGERPRHRGRVGRQHQRERQQRQRRAHQQGLAHAEATARHRTLGGAFDVAVEVAVGHVVDTAASTAHQDGAAHEHQQQVPPRPSPRGQPQRAEGRPQQQQPTRGPVPADQVQVQRQPRAPRGRQGGQGRVHTHQVRRRQPGSSQA